MEDLLDLDFSSSSASTSLSTGAPAAGGRAAAATSNYHLQSQFSSTSNYYSLPSSSSLRATPPPAPTPTLLSSRSATPASYSAARTNLQHGSTPSTTTGTTNGTVKKSDDDAFSSLFSSSAAPAKKEASLSMAERMAGANGNHATTSMSAGFSNQGIRSSSPAFAQQPLKPASISSRPVAAVVDPWDFDLLAPTPMRSSSATTAVADISSKLDTFSLSFDDGEPSLSLLTDLSINRQSTDAPLESPDLLGLLSQPVNHRRSSPAPPSLPVSRPSSSPPPHVLGQIVEMGFSIKQAQLALAATVRPSGAWNVEGALEVLMSQNEAEEQQQQRPHHHQVRRSDENERGNGASSRVEAEPSRPVGRRAREAAQEMEQQREREREESSTLNGKVYQEQAAVLLSQASKIGFSVFKSANAYWESGRATIQKAIDERVGEGGVGGINWNGDDRTAKAEDARNGRPKWMKEELEDAELDAVRSTKTVSVKKGKHPIAVGPGEGRPPLIFQDSDPEDDFDTAFQPQQHISSSSRTRNDATSDWVSSDSPALSARRQEKSRAVESIVVVGSSRQSTPPAPAPIARPKSTRPKRLVVHASSSQISSSASQRIKGNEYFKIGRFAEADAAYTLAIDCLPSSHPNLVPLLNNRASARLHIGGERGAVEDCTLVLRIIFGDRAIDWSVFEDDPFPQEIVSDVSMRDATGKALGRRAKANEMAEKWSLAAQDWTLLQSGGDALCRGAGGMKVVSEGAARCRKAGQGSIAPSTAAAGQRVSTPIPLSIPSTRSAASSDIPSAVTRLRDSNTAADVEDDLRSSLKDSIDAKIASWRSGKETNLRALIASLDNVLWPELQWKTVGLHELLSDSQVKVRYVRAIGKVHPDKLSVSDTTVEQRMIAGAVFSTLNDAWNSSRA